MKLFIINVGVNKSDEQKRKIMSPIFENGSFEFIPIKEGNDKRIRIKKGGNKYSDISCFNDRSKYLSIYLPTIVKDYVVHNDPDFINFTYGDKDSSRSSNLKQVAKNDILLFLARLYKYRKAKFVDSGKLYFVGLFKVSCNLYFDFNKIKELDELNDFKNLDKLEKERFKKNAHYIRYVNEMKDNFRILIGNKEGSYRFNSACEVTPFIAEKIFNGKYNDKNDCFIDLYGNEIKNKNGKNTKYKNFPSNTRPIQCFLDDQKPSEKKSIEDLVKIFEEKYI